MDRISSREIYQARRFPGMHQPLGLYSIHIVVRHGQTTLYGVVDNEGDRQMAEVRAREVTGVFSVENEIVVAKKDAKKTASKVDSVNAPNPRFGLPKVLDWLGVGGVGVGSSR